MDAKEKMRMKMNMMKNRRMGKAQQDMMMQKREEKREKEKEQEKEKEKEKEVGSTTGETENGVKDAKDAKSPIEGLNPEAYKKLTESVQRVYTEEQEKRKSKSGKKKRKPLSQSEMVKKVLTDFNERNNVHTQS